VDIYEFFTENNEYKIRLSKKKRLISYTQYSQYTCSIEFLDNLNNTLIKIDNTELDYFRFIEGLNDFLCNFGQIISDNLYFSPASSGASFFFYIAIADSTGPSEFDDNVYLALYEQSIYGSKLRLNLNTTVSWIEEFIYSLFQIIEDIPYLNELSTTTALEFLDYSQINRPRF
jgi:hypothetical protein